MMSSTVSIVFPRDPHTHTHIYIYISTHLFRRYLGPPSLHKLVSNLLRRYVDPATLGTAVETVETSRYTEISWSKHKILRRLQSQSYLSGPQGWSFWKSSEKKPDFIPKVGALARSPPILAQTIQWVSPSSPPSHHPVTLYHSCWPSRCGTVAHALGTPIIRAGWLYRGLGASSSLG